MCVYIYRLYTYLDNSTYIYTHTYACYIYIIWYVYTYSKDNIVDTHTSMHEVKLHYITSPMHSRIASPQNVRLPDFREQLRTFLPGPLEWRALQSSWRWSSDGSAGPLQEADQWMSTVLCWMDIIFFGGFLSFLWPKVVWTCLNVVQRSSSRLCRYFFCWTICRGDDFGFKGWTVVVCPKTGVSVYS